MKKYIALVLVALLSLSIASAATVAPIAPAAPDLENGVYAVGFDAREITEKTIPVTISQYVLYDAAAVEALQPGDVILYDGEEITVKTIEKEDGFVDVNGRMSDNYTGGGVALMRVDEAGSPYRSFEENDDGLMADVLTVELPLADEVTYRHFAFDLWQSLREDYDSITVPAEDLKYAVLEAMIRFDRMEAVIDFNDLAATEELNAMDADDLDFLFTEGGGMNSIRVEDGKVTEIIVDYHP